ncbi:uncharacterized protein LOC132258044 [Phlebotomus argentipes]|uniref:uncharacterized protein LOC132258044 n=1 Tax=Phlebotomus argentipes TaxID=94469 RepID=UPI002892ECA6|nr:uncharacterized protein LOC132258044 [Phlebotomus argentipes]
MAVEFSVPFLQVPKSLGKFSSSLARGQNPATINFGAILLLSIIAVIGTVIGNFWAPGTSMMNSPGLTSLFKTDADSSTSNNWIWTSVKDSMLKEDGMLNDCAKKFVCLTTAEAIERRRHGINSQLDSLIEGVTRRVHLRDVQPGVSVSMAIERAFSGGCSGHFNNCSAKIQPLQHYLIQ